MTERRRDELPARAHDVQQAADDRHVLKEVVQLVSVLRGVELPEAVRHRGGDDHEEHQQPGNTARLPAQDEERAAADFDQDGEHRHYSGAGKPSLVKYPMLPE